MNNNARLIEFDFLRTIAILIILFHHLPAYCLNYYDLRLIGLPFDFSYLNDINRYLGIGTFVFISGYLQQYSFCGSANSRNAFQFLFRRISRIFPLYIIALVIFQLTLQPQDIKGFLVHMLGMQVLLSSPSVEPIMTLWYIGLIISYYILFILLKRYGRNLRSALLVIFLILGTTLFLKWQFNVIDKRFFIYIAIFIAGMYSLKLLTFIQSKPIIIIPAILSLGLSAFLYVDNIYPLIASHKSFSLLSIVSFWTFLLLSVIMISFVVTLLSISMKISNTLQRLRVIRVISYASFCIYLFHRPFWWLMLKAFHPENDFIRGIYLGGIGIPMLIAISYSIQKLYDSKFRYTKAPLNTHTRPTNSAKH